MKSNIFFSKIFKLNYVKIISYLVYTVVIIFAILAISSKFTIGGFKLLVVMSGSMEPSIKTGSMVIDKNFNDYNIGDVITFKDEQKPKETTTHRVKDKQCQEDVCLFTTKGDANNNADGEQVTEDRIVGKTILSIPYFGYVASLARTLEGLIIFIVIPATIIIYEEFKKIHHETKQIVHKRRKKKRESKAQKVESVNVKNEQENAK